MASVEDRIVRMEFDNAAFEKKLSTTLASLGQLDKALKFTGATKGLTDVSEAANKVSFHTISDGIENVSKGFIALSTIAITTLSNITSRIVQSGLQFVKSFTFGPIFDGFQEFETNANSIQTILANTASKGTTLTQVTDALNLLNTYSDKTIYNFGQMAKNIGTFTAAGVDLDTSVQSIKGIANLAAMSGSSADQASTAMYQLSQAIAAGSLHLMDWNSVVNAGMGGEAFKSALFETAKAMGNVLHVPVSQTFKEWEDSGHSFRDSLQDGWVTADILTTTLSTFTGDMTEEMLLAKGFNEDQAQAILKTAKIAQDAATQVKTFTQLLGTIKEAIGTGFADSFRIVIGNFTEARDLFTSMNNTISGFVSKTADARNAILQGWKDFGARTVLIDTLKSAFHDIALVIGTVRDAFSDIFPPITAATLIRMTASFRDFVATLTPTAETLDKIHRIAAGFFAALSIGWEIIKEGTKFLFGLGKSLLGLVSPEATSFLVKLGDGLVSLQNALVKGGGIKSFFEGLTKALQKPLAFLQKIKEAIGSVFDLFDKKAVDDINAGFDEVGDRFSRLKGIFAAVGNLWEPFENALRKIVDVLDQIWIVIRDWFKELGQKMASVMGKGDFDAVLDAVNTGLLGGIALLLAKFIKSGFSFDLGGGLLDKIGSSFEQLTGVLSAMQTNLKASALLKIAGAIAILTASVVALSLIDSAALTRALSAMAVGFTELIGSFAALTKVNSGPSSAASFSILSAGLIELSVAILILSGAVAILSTLDWENLTKGLLGITGLLGGLSAASVPLSANSEGMISAGAGIAAMGVGLLIISVAMKLLATMSWEEMAKGLTGVAGGLTAIIGAMALMPEDAKLISTGVGIASIGTGLLILSAAVAVFGNMDWKTIGKGFVGIAGGLTLIVTAMNLMPLESVQASAFVLIAAGLLGIVSAMKIVAGMKWGEIGKGLAVIAASLTILIVAMFAMEAAEPGAFALVVITGALFGLAVVLKLYAAMKIMDIVKGLGAIAGVLGVLAGAALLLSESIPILLLFGVAIALIGVGIAGVGAGVFFLAKGFEILANSTEKMIKVLPQLLEAIGKALPALLKGLAEGVIELVLVFIKAAPVFAKLIGVLLEHIIETIIKLTPKVAEAVGLMIDAFINLIYTKADPIIQAGLFLLTKLLEGIRNNIGPLTTLVGDIIVNFLEAFRQQIPRVVDELGQIFITIFTSVAYNLGLVAGTLLFGVGIAFMQGFIQGLENQASVVQGWFGDLPGKIIAWIGDVLGTLWQKGVDLIQGLINGLVAKIGDVASFFSGLAGTFAGYFSGAINWLVQAGNDVIQGFWNGLKAVWRHVSSWIDDVVDEAKHKLTHPWELLSPSHFMKRVGDGIMQGWLVGMQEGWKDVDSFLSNLNATDSVNPSLGNNLSRALSDVVDQMSNMGDLSPTITPVLDLSGMTLEAAKIAGFFDNPSFTPNFSINQARTISSQQRAQQQDVSSVTETPTPGGVVFQQTINSPTRLSTSDIYKQTRNQITIAKEELSIP